MNLSKYSRREAHEVNIGGVKIGSLHPIQVQSMTNTPTADTHLSVAQVKRIADAGAGIVRLTAQGRKEGENLENIVRELREDGYPTAIVADIHFVPEVASIAAPMSIRFVSIRVTTARRMASWRLLSSSAASEVWRCE